LNTVLNLLKASRQGTAYWDWNPRFDSAVHIEGSLNDPSDQDQSWSVQMAMPWSAFESDLLDVPGERSPPTPSLAPPRATVTRVNWIA
ncbi:MAG: carbohydrate-binding family 9-like protein, partial [Candidatus Latescibacteria bacterium]|nr:carbohydrate-binding family 9-like protein [Candidatus Latescibacterota bacterium]